MTGSGRRWLTLGGPALCAGAMAVLVTAVALILGTTGHDWYAAAKMTLVEILLAVGFDAYGVVEYRTADGEALTVKRHEIVYGMVEPWQARGRIVGLVADRAVLGAWTGLVLYVAWLGMRVVAARSGRFGGGSRRAAVEPAPRARPGFAGPFGHPDGWSDDELIAALARRRGRLGVLLVPSAEFERLTDGQVDAAGRSATDPQSLPAAPARALPAPHGGVAAHAKAGGSGEPARAGSSRRPGTANEGEAGADRGGPSQEFY